MFEVATSKTLARRSLTEGPTFIAFTGAEGLFVARDEAVLRFDAKLEQRGERRFERASWLRPVGVVGNRLLVVNRGRFEWLDDKTLASKPLKVPALPEHGQSSFALSADGSRLLVVVPSVEAKKWVFTVNVHLLSTGQQLASTRLEVESAPDVARFLSNDRLLVGGGRTFAILPLQPEPGSGQK